MSFKKRHHDDCDDPGCIGECTDAPKAASVRLQEARKVSEDLDMLASQLRESLSGGGAPPNTWTFDAWLIRYRDVYASRRDSGG